MGQSNVVIDLTGTDITFLKGKQYTTYDSIYGGVEAENATCTANSTLRFSGDAATITLKEQGVRGATIGCGYLNLAVRTNQTWNADPEAYVKVYYRGGAVTAGPEIIRSLDGGRLDNLGKVNVWVTPAGFDYYTRATGMRMAGGSYGGIVIDAGAPGRNYYVVMKDSVAMQGRAVMPSGSTNAAT